VEGEEGFAERDERIRDSRPAELCPNPLYVLGDADAGLYEVSGDEFIDLFTADVARQLPVVPTVGTSTCEARQLGRRILRPPLGALVGLGDEGIREGSGENVARRERDSSSSSLAVRSTASEFVDINSTGEILSQPSSPRIPAPGDSGVSSRASLIVHYTIVHYVVCHALRLAP